MVSGGGQWHEMANVGAQDVKGHCHRRLKTDWHGSGIILNPVSRVAFVVVRRFNQINLRCICYIPCDSVGTNKWFYFRLHFNQIVWENFAFIEQACIELCITCLLSEAMHRVVHYVPVVRLARYGQRAFAYAAPYFWNSLPTDLKDYKLSLLVFNSILDRTF